MAGAVRLIDLATFSPSKWASFAAAEMSLHLARFVVEGLVGQVRVRLGVAYVLDEDAHSIVLNRGNRTSQLVAQVFAGLLLPEIGESAFSLRASATCPHEIKQERTVPA